MVNTIQNMRNKKTLITIVATCMLAHISAMADSICVTKAKVAGPYNVVNPIIIDSIDNAQTKFKDLKVIDTAIDMSLANKADIKELAGLNLQKGSINMIAFDITAPSYIKDANIKITGCKDHKIYVDGKTRSGKITLTPGGHSIGIKFVADSTKVAITMSSLLTIDNGKRTFTMADNLMTKVITSASLSASGNWALISYRGYDSENKVKSETQLINIKTGSKRLAPESARWMPKSDKYYYTRSISGKTQLIAVTPENGNLEVITEALPDGYPTFSPNEEFLIMSKMTNGSNKETGVFEIVHPDDRQPYWRNRYSLAKYDIATGMLQPLTYTYHSVHLNDISQDGNHLLISIMSDSLTQRPTTRQSIYDLDLTTMTMQMLVEKDGFIGSCQWADGTNKIVFNASPEAFGGIGNRVKEGQTPSMFDYHLYIMDRATREVTPVTADDKTSIENFGYSKTDRCVYYTAANGDSVSLYRLDLKTLKSRMISQPLECLSGLDMATSSSNIIVYGSSPCVPYEAYLIQQPAKKVTVKRLLAPNEEMYKDIALGEVKSWSFMSARGDKVTGFYFLPTGFDPAKKYPMIVHYYGGCSPTSRRFGNGSHYPAHYWNAMGYIVLIVNPSGATGFGQEWAARHVNTMGEGPAQDIIDATRQFAKDIPQVDSTKIGCVSASYGGFMTQYMMTKDNPFACGISHAGISDHTSYWGEGYWGYSYSEVSAANSYPWTRKDLFVDRSPLYNADKIKKPILFTHGTADTNVPVGESIQMFTALKLLGIPTAFVEVEGENHGIMDPVKRAKWIDTMVAWFDKWLKNDNSWWESIYPAKHL